MGLLANIPTDLSRAVLAFLFLVLVLLIQLNVSSVITFSFLSTER
jgi:hypothetical protein